ncbi:hypothetical protein RRV45_02900 [Bacillus sp. DTU_2020_1000418_1_SI_GHA_SEK_038]|uniref:hypothetical protein n=1 Tax=Bacillus sp. DTU_2020_1000418_1_SI_GHA_SEK_038 TaxID=3077585 RepID=UPI0028E1FAD4|nr:hypothetical protein [Bacillus sp. DTU_2020_1000418_1_SI_GHA_SEK_038]WNS75983.1 hypothetical protein RRV45_02900 [Bacillus sp. DTU_2020_1000418_1_SI_GHA_SEK_038]
MSTVLTYFVTLIAIVISVFVTLYIKSELERMFQEEKDVFAFHICNVIIILMVAFIVNAVMTIYISGNGFNWMLQLVILVLISLPIYISGHFAFEKYKFVYRKYNTAENGKVIVLNEKYLGKKRPAIFKAYNAAAKESNSDKYRKKRLHHR